MAAAGDPIANEDTSRLPAWAVVASIGLHVMVFGLLPALSGKPNGAMSNLTTADHQPPKVMRLGRERSDAVSITWLGFERADVAEHVAEPSDMVQAASEAQDPKSGELGAAENLAAPDPALASAPPALPVSPPLPASSSTAAAPPSTPQPAPDPRGVLPRATQALASMFADARAAARSPATSEQGGLAEATPGDRESDAFSMDQPLEYTPGRPVAGGGLEIKTRRPNWSISARMLSLPSNPVVRLTFKADGTVARVEFISTTGFESVDEPLRSALYDWRANGEGIRRLGPSDTLDVTITIRLR